MNDSIAEKKAQLLSLPSDASIGELLDAAFRIMGNPSLMNDTSYNLLAYSRGVVTDDRLWNEIIERGTFSHESVNFFNSEHFILSFAESEVLTLMRSDKLKYDRINGKLFDSDNVQLANVCTIACYRPFEEGDTELIELLCEILSKKLQHSDLYPRIERVYKEKWLGGLLDGSADRDTLTDLYAGLKPNLYLAVVDVIRYEETLTHLAYFCDLFRRLQPQHKYFVHLNSILAFLSTDRPMLSVQHDLPELGKFFAETRICAGVSSQFDSLDGLQMRHREAIVALNYGLSGKRNQQIFFYDDYRVEHRICTAGIETDAIRSPVIARIQAHDGALLDVLYMYLLYGLHAPTAADALNMDADAFALALNELRDRFGVDWRNGDMLMNLYVSLKMMDNK